MRDIKLNEIKTPKELLELFTEYKKYQFFNHKDLLLTNTLICDYTDYIIASYTSNNNKVSEIDDFNPDLRNIPDYVMNYFDYYKKDVKDITIARLEFDKIEDLTKYDKNNCTLVFSHQRVKQFFSYEKDITDFILLENNYSKYLLLKDREVEFPLDYFIKEFNIQNKKLIDYFESQKLYIEEIMLPKIEKCTPSIIFLILDFMEYIDYGVYLDEYGNTMYYSGTDAELSYTEYAEKYFIRPQYSSQERQCYIIRELHVKDWYEYYNNTHIPDKYNKDQFDLSKINKIKIKQISNKEYPEFTKIKANNNFRIRKHIADCYKQK